MNYEQVSKNVYRYAGSIVAVRDGELDGMTEAQKKERLAKIIEEASRTQ